MSKPDSDTAPRRARPAPPEGDRKERVQARLRRIEGQVRGLQRMVDEERYCADILTQLSSVQEALRGVGREMLRNHLQQCVTHALRTGGRDQAEAVYDELVLLFDRHSR